LISWADHSIRQDLGESVKAHLAHMLVYDTRDDAILPKTGVFLRSRHELCGSDASMLKSETESQISFQLPSHFVHLYVYQ